MRFRRDPGPCPVDDAPHTTCCAPAAGPLTVIQLPQRDGVAPAPLVGGVMVPPLVGDVQADVPLLADRIQATLPPGQVTSGTYRGKRPLR